MNRYKNKKFIIRLSLVIALVVILVALKPWKQPSQEMLNLRQIEQQLSLPASEQRTENDIGRNADWKGSRTYTRHIRLHYDNATNVESVVQELSSSGWSQVNESESDDPTIYNFINKKQRACIFARIASESVGSSQQIIHLGSDKDYYCSLYFRNE